MNKKDIVSTKEKENGRKKINQTKKNRILLILTDKTRSVVSG